MSRTMRMRELSKDTKRLLLGGRTNDELAWYSNRIRVGDKYLRESSGEVSDENENDDLVANLIALHLQEKLLPEFEKTELESSEYGFSVGFRHYSQSLRTLVLHPADTADAAACLVVKLRGELEYLRGADVGRISADDIDVYAVVPLAEDVRIFELHRSLPRQDQNSHAGWEVEEQQGTVQLTLKEVPGDNHCQYRSVLLSYFGTDSNDAVLLLRRCVACHLEALHRNGDGAAEQLEQWAESNNINVQQYLQQVDSNGWGDAHTLAAITAVLKVRVMVYQRVGEGLQLRSGSPILPHGSHGLAEIEGAALPIVRVLFKSEVHYDALLSSGDVVAPISLKEWVQQQQQWVKEQEELSTPSPAADERQQNSRLYLDALRGTRNEPLIPATPDQTDDQTCYDMSWDATYHRASLFRDKDAAMREVEWRCGQGWTVAVMARRLEPPSRNTVHDFHDIRYMGDYQDAIMHNMELRSRWPGGVAYYVFTITGGN